MNCFSGMFDRQRRVALFPAGTIVRDPHYRESPTRRKQNLNLQRTRLTWMKLCSSDNHYTTLPLNSKIGLAIVSNIVKYLLPSIEYRKPTCSSGFWKTFSSILLLPDFLNFPQNGVRHITLWYCNEHAVILTDSRKALKKIKQKIIFILSHSFPVHALSNPWKLFQGVKTGCIGNEWVKTHKLYTLTTEQ